MRGNSFDEDVDALRDLLGADYLAVLEPAEAGAFREVAAAGAPGGGPSPRLVEAARQTPVFRAVGPADRTAWRDGVRHVYAAWLPGGRIAYAAWRDADPPDERAVLAVVRAVLALLGPGAAPAPAAALRALPADAEVVETPLGPLIFRSEAMRRVVEDLRLVAPAPEPVLLVGETGAGKTLLGAALHAWSGRRGPFVWDSAAAAVGRDLFRVRLFGARAGAWTDLRESTVGLIEYARGGTLLLDEVGDADPADQAALLGVVESGRYTRVGEVVERLADVRWVFATHRPERLRADLLHRCLFGAAVPPLRERPEDVEPLFAFHAGRPLEPGALKPLQDYPWPGNVRELQALARAAGRLAAQEGRPEVGARHVEAARRLQAHITR